jgi:hypothetical protein
MLAWNARGRCAVPDRIYDVDPELHAEAETERQRNTWTKAGMNGPAPVPGVPADVICTRATLGVINEIPPRAWAYGSFLLFGSASVIGAVDGGGKGALATVIALAMITGRPLLGERVWRTGPVAIITYEDDEPEWRRRIAAACLHYSIDYKSVIGSFYFIHRPGSRVCFVAQERDGYVFPDGGAIIDHLKAIEAVILIVDPFNQAHALDDGNNNVAIAKVAGEVSRIAAESKAAVLVLHHLRKGSVGTPDDLMGATSLRAIFRSCRILARMSAKEAEAINLPRAQVWRYSRISGSKENYAPPPEFATWYLLESINLGNGAGIYPNGDNVQVSTTWTPPDVFEGLSLATVSTIFDAIRKGFDNGEFYSPDKRSSERWAGNVIVKAAGKTAAEAGNILRIWLSPQKEVLKRDQYHSPSRREDIARVIVNETKAAEILRPLCFKSEDGE